MMSIEQLLPPTSLTLLSVAFSLARFENQRWTRFVYRDDGGAAKRQGSSSI
jgi:hypothetical protein